MMWSDPSSEPIEAKMRVAMSHYNGRQQKKLLFVLAPATEIQDAVTVQGVQVRPSSTMPKGSYLLCWHEGQQAS
jgi:hypothetical protein